MGFRPGPAQRPIVPRKRLALSSSGRRIKYEYRVRLWLAALALPVLISSAWLGYLGSSSLPVAGAVAAGVAMLWAIACATFFGQLVRPLQTLTNVVAALRDDDFSFRARGARRGDALGDLALEINALAGTLQTQRASARDALTLVERVMTSMQAPVFAFDDGGRLLLLNAAAEEAFGLVRRTSLGRSAGELTLGTLLLIEDEGLFEQPSQNASVSGPRGRWSVRRTTFRLHGRPHALLVLADVSGALREEERLAWQRLIRVLSHEINNSMTPIMSIAGSLRSRVPAASSLAASDAEDLRRGLGVIEERAASLTRFLRAYQQMTRLPPPRLQRVSVLPLLRQVLPLETRLTVELAAGPPLFVEADPDQLQQLLINLIRNAVEAAVSSPENTAPRVWMTWSATPLLAVLQVHDNGLGLIDPANLFVPFYTTKPEGSGIGLVLAQQIASAHKGTVVLYNHPAGAGCVAELRLPLTAGA